MSELNDHPENMTCIINIQTMQEKIGDKVSPVETLENLHYDWLHEMQNNLITRYNQAVA
jgi:hypothetical protein